MKNNSYDKKIFRFIYILNKLNSGTPLKTAELANEFNVTQRTVQRDLELLNEAGFPLVYDEDGHKFMDGFSLQKIMVNPEERFLLNTLYKLFSKAGSPFNTTVKNFLNKVLLSAKTTTSALDKKPTVMQMRIVKEKIKKISESLEPKYEDIPYPANFKNKIDEFLKEVREKVKLLKEKKKVDIRWSFYRIDKKPRILATILVPKTFFDYPFLKSDLFLNQKQFFEIQAFLPNKFHRTFRIRLNTGMSLRLRGEKLNNKEMICFDDFASYLGFPKECKEVNFRSSHKDKDGMYIGDVSFTWEKNIPISDKEIESFLEKISGIPADKDYPKEERI